MKRSNLYLALVIGLLMALPVAAQTFPRKPAPGEKTTTAEPDRKVTALPVVEGDPDDPNPTRITIKTLKQKLDAKEDVVILDVRSKTAYLGSTVRIKGAVRIPPEEIQERMKELPKNKLIVPYCTCPDEATSGSVAETLLQSGFKSVKALIGGFDAWEAADFPTEPKVKGTK